MGLFSSFGKKSVFISYAHQQRDKAEQVAYRLRTRDYEVFLDRTSLKAGQSFDDKIRIGLESSNVFVFLISPESVRSGSYCLTELQFAERKWPNPTNRILPVMVARTPMEYVPPYLKSVQIMTPQGDLAAEVLSALEGMDIASAGGSGPAISTPSRPSMPSMPSMPKIPSIPMPVFGKRRIFISYSRSDANQASELARMLDMQGHEVLWEGGSVTPGKNYEMLVQQQIKSADTLVYLVSPDSVRMGSRALGELALAMSKWPSAAGNVLPVAIAPTPRDAIPAYLRATEILVPSGNIGFEVIAALDKASASRPPLPLHIMLGVLGFIPGMLTRHGVGVDDMQDERTSVIIYGFLVAAVLVAGILLSRTKVLRQAISAAVIIALGTALGALVYSNAWASGAVKDWSYLGILGGGIFGFFAQLALAINVPAARQGVAWLLVPLSAMAVWSIALRNVEFSELAWVLWPVAFLAWTGFALMDSKSGKRRSR